MTHLLAALLIALGALPDPGPASQRHAIIVGNNRGTPPHRPLRYANDDARRLSATLLAVGGFKQENVVVLEDAGRTELIAAFDFTKERLAAGKGGRDILLFYYSGHSDGLSLEMGGDPVTFVEVRSRLEASGADVRLAILDTCLSGDLIGLKGVSRVEPFEVEIEGDMETRGTVILTSSTAGEAAQESSEIGGAFFTHHLVSALYGAADSDGDLKVSLREAYRYAYRNTVGDTVKTVAGTQHPGYLMRLEGRGDLVLAALAGDGGILSFPSGMDGSFFVLAQPSGEVVAELTHAKGRVANLFVAPGRYLVATKSVSGLTGVEVSLKKGDTLSVNPDDFVTIRRKLADVRGGKWTNTRSLLASYCMSGWLMPGMGPVHSGGLLFRQRIDMLELQFRANFGAAEVNDLGFIYDMQVVEGAIAPLLRIPLYDLDILVGPVVGASWLRQDSTLAGKHMAWSFDGGMLAGVSSRLADTVSFLFAWEVDVHVFSRDGEVQGEWGPRAVLGVGYDW